MPLFFRSDASAECSGREALLSRCLILSFSFYLGLLLIGVRTDRWWGLFALPFVFFLIRSVRDGTYTDLGVFLDRRTLAALACIQGLGWLGVTVAEYFSVSYQIFDTGIFAHLAFNISSGRGFYSYILQRPALADHFTPNMALLAPLFRLKASILWLPLARLLAYASCLAVLWCLSGLYLKEARLRYLVCIMWLVSYPLMRVLHFEFQPSSLALPFVLLAFYWCRKGYRVLLVIDLLLLLGFKEHLALVWVSLGLWLITCEKRRWQGMGLALGGIGAGLAVVYVLTPLLSAGVPSVQLAKFLPLSHGAAKARLVFLVFLSVGFLPLLRPATLLFILPALAMSLVSGVPEMATLKFHYQDVPSAVVFVGVIVGLSAWERREGWFFRMRPAGRKVLVAISLLGLTLSSNYHPARCLREEFPTAGDIALVREVHSIRPGLDPSRVLWSLDCLGAYFIDFPKLRSIQSAGEPFAEAAPHYIVVADTVDRWPIGQEYGALKAALARAVEEGRYRLLPGEEYLQVYESMPGMIPVQVPLEP